MKSRKNTIKRSNLADSGVRGVRLKSKLSVEASQKRSSGRVDYGLGKLQLSIVQQLELAEIWQD